MAPTSGARRERGTRHADRRTKHDYRARPWRESRDFAGDATRNEREKVPFVSRRQGDGKPCHRLIGLAAWRGGHKSGHAKAGCFGEAAQIGFAVPPAALGAEFEIRRRPPASTVNRK